MSRLLLGGWPTSRGISRGIEGCPISRVFCEKWGPSTLMIRRSGCGDGQRLGDIQDEGAGHGQTIDSIRCPRPTSRKRREKWGTHRIFSSCLWGCGRCGSRHPVTCNQTLNTSAFAVGPSRCPTSRFSIPLRAGVSCWRRRSISCSGRGEKLRATSILCSSISR